jgi:arrestin-related trafficking adapter 3/6
VSTDNGTKDGYKEFNKGPLFTAELITTWTYTVKCTGVYTYPISLMIPGNAPPTLKCLHGNVTWRLKGHVHRPGTFSHKLSASREVILVASPGECYTEDVENTIVQRQRDSQLQYMISISGRSFHIGGTLPIRIAILPTTQIKVHNISVILEGMC